LKWKKTYVAFQWKKVQQNRLIFEKMPLLRRLMKDVWLGGTFYVSWNGNVEVRMLKSAPKTLNFYYKYISSWYWCVIFFKSFWGVEKKIWGCEVTPLHIFYILKKFTKNWKLNHFLIWLYQWIQWRNHLGSLCCLWTISQVNISNYLQM